jgi:hypothetical protein
MSALEILKKEDGYWLSIDGKTKALIHIDSKSPMVIRAIEEVAETNEFTRLNDRVNELEEDWGVENAKTERLQKAVDSAHIEADMLLEITAQLRNRIAELEENAKLFIKYIKNGENQKSHLQMLVLESCLTKSPEPPKEAK